MLTSCFGVSCYRRQGLKDTMYDTKTSSMGALTKYYIVSVLIVITLAFPDQGKRDFVLSQVMNMSYLIKNLENIF
jgi:hypothetical protein